MSADPAAESSGPDLTDQERLVLDFERSWWTGPGPKGTAIRERLAMSPSQYRRILQGLLDDPAADAYDPLTVRRLRRRRDDRRRERAGGRRADPRLP